MAAFFHIYRDRGRHFLIVSKPSEILILVNMFNQLERERHDIYLLPGQGRTPAETGLTE